MMATIARSSVLFSTLLVALVGFAGVACSSKKSGDGNSQAQNDAGHTGNEAGILTGTRPCDGALKDECGVKCSVKKPCSDGLYCMDGACTADCTPTGGQCSGTCTADGHCVRDDNTPGPTTLSDADTNNCIEQEVQFESLTPTVELLIDRSDSMTKTFDGKSRWNTIRDILVDPTAGFTKLYESQIRFGLALYTGLRNVQCPNLIEVPFALNNYKKIHDVFVANETGDNTPTAESLQAVTTELVNYTEIGPKVIVLATDGDPDTCAMPDSNKTDPPKALSLAAVQAAWAKHIATYVISVGDEPTQSHLQDLARAGRGGDATAMPYQALDANSLSTAFDSILGNVVSCDLELNGEVAPGDADKGTVIVATASGVTADAGEVSRHLVYQDPNGYEMPTTTSVRLLGTACDTIKHNPNAEVHIKFPCNTITIIR